MAIDRERARQYLKSFDFARLFTQELGWDKYSASIAKQIDGHNYLFKAVAEKHGVVILVSDSIPEYSIRVKLDKLVAKDHFEHLIVFADQAHGRQVWQWFRKEPGKPVAVRTYHYASGQSGELLLQKLEGLVFTLDEEEILTLTSVTGRLKAFDVEKVTKKFYERFKTEHSSFLKFIEGIPDKQMETWYASVMVNRLMFLYFIQEKGFLNGDKDYLRNKLKESRDRKPDAYYRDFLCPLFFQGFARKKEERSAAVNKLLGEIPYLNGGLFQPHQIEELHGKQIVIPDKAFKGLFNFFKEYDWHLDERENRNDCEINPDVLGYIFEKYINQKQMGAYYTKEDITEYIAQNTIIPFLLDEARKGCAVAFAPEGSVWRLLRDDPNRYIHDAMKWGADISLPTDIEAGIADVKKRTGWNRTAPEEFALPTEIWREVIDRHQRYRSVKAKLASGEICQVNDLVTLNLNIRQFAQDVIQFCEGPELLRAIWKVIEKVSVLDPTCGSGAFLFAALNILKPLYEACLIRMQGFIEDMESAGPHHPTKFSDFKQTLDESKRHPKQDYFILKAIIVNNLFGVDIMEEAVEICKLRLFLKLIAQVESQDRIEPLPDIDFNIRAGNTLVGYALKTDFQPSRGIRTDEENRMIAQVEDEALSLDAKVRTFRLQQTRLDGTVDAEDKNGLRKQFTALESKLNEYLSNEYAAKRTDRSSWAEVHKPFHWLCDFHSIMQSGGFDVIIGNPPYVEIPKSYSRSYLGRLYKSALPVWSRDEDLYTLVVERSLRVLKNDGRFGMILPLSLCFSTKKPFVALRRLVGEELGAWWWSHFDRIPSALFGSEVRTRCTIALLARSQHLQHRLRATTSLLRWTEEQRPKLFKDLRYSALSTDILEGIPKVSSQEQADVLQKMLKAGRPLPLDGPRSISYSFLVSAAPDFPQPCVYVGGTAYNWFPAWRDIPPTTGEDGRPSLPARTAGMQYVTEEEANIVFALLCSSLGYWWWAIASDGFNLKRWLIDRFPLSIGSIDPKGRKEVGLLGKQLRSALRKQYVYKDNKGRIGNYYLPACDELIREIDQVLVSYVPVLTAEFMADIQVFNQSFSRNEDASSGEDEDEE
jgi:type I restriction-modification system DNA methylase subunit